MVEKSAAPQVEVCEVILEVPQMLVRESRGEVPHVVKVELIRQVPSTDCGGTVDSDFHALAGSFNLIADSNPEVESCSALLNRALTTPAGASNAPDNESCLVGRNLDELDTCPKRTFISFEWDDTLCRTSAMKDLGIGLRRPLPLSAQPCLRETSRVATDCKQRR